MYAPSKAVMTEKLCCLSLEVHGRCHIRITSVGLGIDNSWQRYKLWWEHIKILKQTSNIFNKAPTIDTKQSPNILNKDPKD